MALPAIVAWKERDNVGTLVQILLYFLAFVFIVYMMYKLFGMFKEWGQKIENAASELKNELGEMPEKFSQTGKDVLTMVTKPGTPEGNAAKTRVHYGSPEYAPGNAPPVNPKTGVMKRYGQGVKPGESKTFAGATYIEKDVNNMVKDPTGSGYVPREDALAHKYGFSTYAQFNAWLTGVKAALKAEGKDPSQMSLAEIVAYGRELEKKKEAYNKTLDAYSGGTPAGAKPLPLPKADKLLREVYTKTPGGGIVIGYTPVIKPQPKHEPVKHILPVDPRRRLLTR